MRKLLYTWLLNMYYKDQPLIGLSTLSSSSKAFENNYKEERYTIIKRMGPSARGELQRLMELDMNYLNRKLHDTSDVKRADHLKGRIFQNLYYYTVCALVGSVRDEDDIVQ